ncbi:E3 SUMO-protein ligase ZBED1-like isoform X2 [Prorops nasuta]|uniref:E3 SUMO-protein ligase ZBED1-like isoform X2 n=1 Tax=Prorops nasuta TaxID=863751 RepID=UPI0034CFFEB8
MWKYFIKINTGGKCKLCLQEVKGCNNTTNMKFHLSRRHPDVLEKLAQGQVEKVTPYNLNKRSYDFAFNEEDNEDDNFNLPASTSTYHVNDASSKASEAITTEQITIVDSFARQNSFKDGGSQSNKITNTLLFMLAKDMLPYRTVEKEGFLLYTNTLAPLYKVPCRKTITKLMAEKYNVLSDMVRSEICKIENLSVTTDIWTDPINVKSFLGITLHYLMKDKLKSVTIGVVELSERHTAEYIQLCLETELNLWKVNKNQILIVVSDNGANIKKAIKDGLGNESHMPCFAHNLHLVKSVMASDYLRVISNLKLIMAVDTRWNSTFYMLERFLELSEKVSSVLLKCPTAPNMLTAMELQTAKELLQLLRIFEQSTKIVCGENYITASKIIPIINILKSTLKEVTVESETAETMKALLLHELQHRFVYIKDTLILSISTILDPRFKQIHFDDEDVYAQAIDKIVSEINDARFNSSDNSENDLCDNILIEKDFCYLHENLIGLRKRRSINNINNGNEIPTELKYYLDEPQINITECPIKFWFKKTPTLLSKLALKYLSIVGTSVPSERLFSKACRILNESRNRLNTDHLQHLLFLESLSKEYWSIE